jgi:hypothetical protein
MYLILRLLLSWHNGLLQCASIAPILMRRTLIIKWEILSSASSGHSLIDQQHHWFGVFSLRRRRLIDQQVECVQDYRLAALPVRNLPHLVRLCAQASG